MCVGGGDGRTGAVIGVRRGGDGRTDDGRTGAAVGSSGCRGRRLSSGPGLAQPGPASRSPARTRTARPGLAQRGPDSGSRTGGSTRLPSTPPLLPGSRQCGEAEEGEVGAEELPVRTRRKFPHEVASRRYGSEIVDHGSGNRPRPDLMQAEGRTTVRGTALQASHKGAAGLAGFSHAGSGSLGLVQTRRQQKALETRARSTWRRRVRSSRFMSPIQPAESPAGQEDLM
jgi:hypothetical protein